MKPVTFPFYADRPLSINLFSNIGQTLIHTKQYISLFVTKFLSCPTLLFFSHTKKHEQQSYFSKEISILCTLYCHYLCLLEAKYNDENNKATYIQMLTNTRIYNSPFCYIDNINT